MRHLDERRLARLAGERAFYHITVTEDSIGEQEAGGAIGPRAQVVNIRISERISASEYQGENIRERISAEEYQSDGLRQLMQEQRMLINKTAEQDDRTR